MKTDEQLIETLERLTKCLYVMSESDYPFEIVRLENTNAVHLRKIRDQSTDANIEIRSIEDFFRAAILELKMADGMELAPPNRSLTLVKFLNENLDEPRVYKIGRISSPVFILGRLRTGNWTGLSTRVVET